MASKPGKRGVVSSRLSFDSWMSRISTLWDFVYSASSVGYFRSEAVAIPLHDGKALLGKGREGGLLCCWDWLNEGD